MNDELTEVDIQKMKEELEARRANNANLRDEVKRAKELGDLSENDEYRSAKREFNRNKSRMRYLTAMINSAVVIKVDSKADEIGLFDRVDLYYPKDGRERTVRIVTTLRNDVLKDCISKESPFGQALLGHKLGETVTVKVSEKVQYQVVIRNIVKGEDDPDLPISSF